MQLLIVDDENIVVEDLKTNVDWLRIGIKAVFTAFNIRQAKEVFADNNIDIMLCDIEMPQGSGLELLSWVRDNHPKTESIFLTCHADFSYAKEAIRLGSLDYILKPVPYAELEAIIAKAIEKIKKDNKLMEDSRFGQFWFKHLPAVIERFWLDVLNRTIPSNQESIKKAAEERNIPYTQQMRFLPVLISIRRWHKELSLHDEKTMEFALKNAAAEIILEEGANGQVIQFGTGVLLVILSLWNYVNSGTDQLKKNCETFIAGCNRYFYCDLACYTGSEAYAHELPLMVDRLIGLDKNNVIYDNKVFLLTSQDNIPVSLNLPDMNLWSVMLAEGSTVKLISEITNYLENVILTAGLDANKLKQFHHDFMQMVYSTLKQKGIRAHQLLNDSESVKLYDQATHSVTDLIAWTKHVVGKVAEYAVEFEKSQSVVNKVKGFIKVNLEQELTHEEIASHFYLNPDYLDRIFKKETGKSVTKFMVQERLNKTKELLSKTGVPISTIAVSLGYKNLSHFSAAFKRYTSMNPVDYRKIPFKKDV